MKHLLSSSAFLVVNKSLAKQIGLKETVLLADLISKEEYFIANGMTDGWFFNTEANIEADTTLTPFMQRKCLKALRKYGIIETKRKGVPAKQFFKINEQLVVKFLNNLSLTKSTTINKNKEIRIINNTISNRKEKFILEVSSFDYEESVLNDFVDYWTEPNKSGTKMKYELQKTWSTNLRLKTWAKNSKRWNTPKSAGMSKLDSQINAWQEAKKLL
jgi:hypothetical protein|tara:strand:+ start:1118 stop:1765 length:648 start_codon:yes stop_codon:yes gene_type:complete